MRFLCIDPGTEVSGVVSLDPESLEVSCVEPHRKNQEIADMLPLWRDDNACLAIEMFASYGMRVGKESFETLLWTGRFMEIFGWKESYKVLRKDVRLTICNSPRANDASIRRALIDLFPRTGGGKTPQIGTKKQPGPLYGVSDHAWSALGVGLTFAETNAYRDLRVIDRI